MATTAVNKVTYGLSNVHVWPITSTDATGKPTYGTMIPIPGAVEISLSPEGSSDPFYADDGIYFQSSTNAGYSGDLTIADIPTDFLVNVMKEEKDANGVMFENSDVVPNEFAIGFEFKGDVNKRRHIFYRCVAKRPEISSKTKEDKIDPNTPKLSITCLPRIDTKVVKASCEENDKGYASFFSTAPYEKATSTT